MKINKWAVHCKDGIRNRCFTTIDGAPADIKEKARMEGLALRWREHEPENVFTVVNENAAKEGGVR